MKRKNVDATKNPKPNGPTNGENKTDAKETAQGTFQIQRLFTKGVTFDAPNLTSLFGKEWKPKVDINIQSSNKALEDNLHEVELNINVSATMENEAVFNVGVKQVGIFAIQNFTAEQLKIILSTECLKILYPYARETITDLTSRATLPQIYLTPINFDAVYAQQLQQAQKGSEGKKDS